MTKAEIRQSYFQWICRRIDSERKAEAYSKLLNHLHRIPFRVVHPMDMNREEDGADLRYRFACEEEIDSRLIRAYLDDRPCSVLEMMAALSLRCEEDIMDDPTFGDRTGVWFWGMIDNLGLSHMDNTGYYSGLVDTIIDNFLNRNYAPDGKGGLFTVRNTNRDLKTVEIWCQLCWYMDEIIKQNGG